MIKEEKPLFFRVVLVIGVILLINLGILSYKYGSTKVLTGLSVKDTLSKTYKDISPASKVFLVMQWVVLILILIFSFVKDKNSKIVKNELAGINIEKMSEKKGTDLDTLYNLLKTKKELRISTVARVFKIGKTVAMEWCKILEAGNLAIIEYPSSREPVIKIIEK